VVNVGLLKGGS